MAEDMVQKGYELAKKARSKAYAPYSKFLVGAAFKLEGCEDFVVGCNVENGSFGATVCAERVALWSWAANLRKEKGLEFLVLVTDTSDPVATPCGLCLQVLGEFLSPEFPIHIANMKGIHKEVKLKELLPTMFKLNP